MILRGIFIIYFVLFSHLSWSFAGYGVGRNLTNFFKHRQKRGLIFNNGGATKVKFGIIKPSFKNMLNFDVVLVENLNCV